jgi:hypothetical protein
VKPICVCPLLSYNAYSVKSSICPGLSHHALWLGRTCNICWRKHRAKVSFYMVFSVSVRLRLFNEMWGSHNSGTWWCAIYSLLWRQKQQVLPKCGYLSTRFCAVTSLKKHFQVYIGLLFFIVHILFITIAMVWKYNNSLGIGWIWK